MVDKIFTQINDANSSDDRLPESDLLNTEEKMRRFIIALTKRVEALETTVNQKTP